MSLQNEYTRMREIFFALCKSADTPISLGAWLRFQHNQLALAEMEIHPRDYLDAESFRQDYIVVSFLSKWKGLDTGLDLEAEALRRFISSESSCGETNKRLRLSRKEGLPPLLSSIIPMARRRIANLIGPFSVFCLDDKFGWGPGATDDIPRRRAFVDSKLCELPISVTRRCLPLVKAVISHDLHWSSVILGCHVEDLVGPFSFLPHVFALTEGCVIDTVPKNAKTHRVIAKEPRANGFLQKGAGAWFRQRLRRVGIDLNDQTRNQDAARRALDDGLATLDLKGASDSVSVELVYELFSVDWALALDDLRSPRAFLPDGQTITLEKFSSMGNGFTFELESLIFWAITSSVKSLLGDRKEVLVYGDDIICSKEISSSVIESLSYIGFQTNEDKTFVDGNFYESCGKHYFKNEEVTPIYQKQPITSEVETLRMGNRIMRLAYRYGHGYQLRKNLYQAWSAAWRMAGESRQYQIPLGADGDDGWLLPACDFVPRPQDLNLGLRCKVFRPRQVSFPANEPALLAWTLRRGVVTEAPYQGQVTSSPDTTESSSTELHWEMLQSATRWVMPTGEFDSNW